MTDVWLVMVLSAFFGLCVGFVMVCERIIGPSPEAMVDEPEDVAA